MAMLHLAVEAGLAVEAVTVDHGLRAESAAEAEGVARSCADLGVPHAILRWQGWDRRGNLQDQARRARLALMAEWAARRGLAAVALAHTADDVAETFLMRLARGAGVDGLAAMPARRRHLGTLWLRPLLDVGRAELRDWLTARGIRWAEDPSNENPRFDRVRARRALACLSPLGVSTGGLVQVASHLAEVRAALEVQTLAAVRAMTRAEAGDVVLDARALTDPPAEITRRVLARALTWVASAEYGPRGPQLARATEALRAGRPATLMGCRMLPGRGEVRITREWRAVRDSVVPASDLWDGRWRVFGPQSNGLTLRALGADGLAQCPAWRAVGVPRASLMSSPSVWRAETLVAAPLAGRAEGWRAVPEPGWDTFQCLTLSH